MMRFIPFLIVLVVLSNMAIAQEPTPEQIQTAITKGKAFLYAKQNAEGTWDGPKPAVVQVGGNQDSGQWGGRTAMAVYALVACGEKSSEPRLQKAIEFLHTSDITGTYAVGMKCLVWSHLPQTAEVKKSMNRDARLLLVPSMLKQHKSGVPVYDYGPGRTSLEWSLSRTQYGTLGLWAATETGVEIPLDKWKALEKTWETTQTPEGGWKYRFVAESKGDFEPTTVSLTAAAVSSLYLIQDFTKGEFYAGAKGNASSPAIEKGIKWMAANFDAKVGTKSMLPREFQYAQLYAIERAGLLSGLRRFGEHDWYARGAKWILSRQSGDGWKGDEFGPIPSTCWAILFLQRGRTPVAFNKLDYSVGVADPQKALWNQRPRDVANVTRWLSRSLERELRWQIVRSDASVEAMLESPILYMAGEGTQSFSEDTKAKLKSYVEHGGLILAHADTSDAAFTKSIIELGTSLFPPNEWRDLPENHVLYTNQIYKRAGMKSRPPAMKAISNGVRVLMIVIPTGDFARTWQLRDQRNKSELWETAANILAYTADKTNFYPRGESWILPKPTAAPKRTVTVGRLKYQGNWDPEPQAFVQLGNYTLTEAGLEVKLQTIETGKPIEKVNLVHVTGTTKFELDDATRTALKEFAAKGGTILFEAAGGGGDFTESAELEINKLYGIDNLKPLPSTSPIYGKDLKIDYRPFNISTIANPGGPTLRGVERDGRVVALLSREDISAGLLGIPTDGIIGYKPASARKLMLNLLSSLK